MGLPCRPRHKRAAKGGTRRAHPGGCAGESGDKTNALRAHHVCRQAGRGGRLAVEGAKEV